MTIWSTSPGRSSTSRTTSCIRNYIIDDFEVLLDRPRKERVPINQGARTKVRPLHPELQPLNIRIAVLAVRECLSHRSSQANKPDDCVLLLYVLPFVLSFAKINTPKRKELYACECDPGLSLSLFL